LSSKFEQQERPEPQLGPGKHSLGPLLYIFSATAGPQTSRGPG